MHTLKIVSGGQTGVDRGALAAALATGTHCGGWCPEGRLSEDGPIPPAYPVVELAGAGYRERTLQNVLDSDGTAIIHQGELEGGTRLTRTYCVDHARPYLLIDMSAVTRNQAIEAVIEFVATEGIRVLNVAGPRTSKWPEAFSTTRRLLSAALRQLA